MTIRPRHPTKVPSEARAFPGATISFHREKMHLLQRGWQILIAKVASIFAGFALGRKGIHV
jgi:hypothetical protein